MPNPFADAGLSDRDFSTGIGTMFGETLGTRSQNFAGMAAIGDVIGNRQGNPGSYLAQNASIDSIARAPNQFSTWNGNIGAALDNALLGQRLAQEYQANPAAMQSWPSSWQQSFSQAYQALAGLAYGKTIGAAYGADQYANPNAASRGSLAAMQSRTPGGVGVQLDSHTFFGPNVSQNPFDFAQAQTDVIQTLLDKGIGLPGWGVQDSISEQNRHANWAKADDPLAGPATSFDPNPAGKVQYGGELGPAYDNNVQSYGDYNEASPLAAATTQPVSVSDLGVLGQDNVQSYGDYNEPQTQPNDYTTGPATSALDAVMGSSSYPSGTPSGWMADQASLPTAAPAVDAAPAYDGSNVGWQDGISAPANHPEMGTVGEQTGYTTGGSFGGEPNPSGTSTGWGGPAVSPEGYRDGGFANQGYTTPDTAYRDGGFANPGYASPTLSDGSVDPYGFAGGLDVSGGYTGQPFGFSNGYGVSLDTRAQNPVGAYDFGSPVNEAGPFEGGGVGFGNLGLAASIARDSYGVSPNVGMQSPAQGYASPTQAYGPSGMLSLSMPMSMTSYETVTRNTPQTTYETVPTDIGQSKTPSLAQKGAFGVGVNAFNPEWSSIPLSVDVEDSKPATKTVARTVNVPETVSVPVTKTVSTPATPYQAIMTALDQGGTPKSVASQIATAYTSPNFDPQTWSGVNAPQNADLGWAGKGLYDAKTNAFLGGYDPSDPANSPAYVTHNYPYGAASGDTSGSGYLGDSSGNTYNLGFNPGDAAYQAQAIADALGYGSGGSYGGGMASGFSGAEPGQGIGGANWN